MVVLSSVVFSVFVVCVCGFSVFVSDVSVSGVFRVMCCVSDVSVSVVFSE